MAGISITPEGVSFPIPGANVIVNYDPKTKTLTITGLDESDRVIHRTATGSGPHEQSVIVKLDDR